MASLDSALPDAVRALLAQLRRNLQQALDERGLRATVPEVQVLLLINTHPGISPMDIAQQTGYDKSVIARKLSVMQESGLIERSVHPDDSRRSQLTTTARGRERCGLLQEVLTQTHEATFAALTDLEQRRLVELISKCLAGS